jgi:hypothetical protein
LFGFLLTGTETEYLPNTENNHHIEEIFVLGGWVTPKKIKKKEKEKHSGQWKTLDIHQGKVQKCKLLC